MGAWPSRASTKRVREPPRDVRRRESDGVGRPGGVRLRNVARITTRAWRSTRRRRRVSLGGHVRASGTVTGGLDRASVAIDPLGPYAMLKFGLALVIGISIGYFYGFDDAKKHVENVVERVVGKVGTKGEKYRTDVDKQMEAAEKK